MVAARLALSMTNNFTLLRLFAATLVILAHAYPLTGSSDVDWFEQFTGRTFGWAAVSVFFVISGYLITQSLMRNPSLLRFARARALRIFPGLIVCVLLTTVLLGVFVSNDDQFFARFQTAFYVVGNATLMKVNYVLPGVFASNPYPDAVNGSLWTLPIEVACYVGAAILFTLAGKRLGLSIAGLLAGLLCVYALDLAPDNHRVRLAFAFLLGMAYAASPVRLEWWHTGLAVLAAGVLLSTRFNAPALNLALAVTTLWFAFADTPRLTRVSVAIPDWSYGVYIYAFPVQQTVAMLWPGLSPLQHFGVALGLTLIPAALSWHLVEKPALRLKAAPMVPTTQHSPTY
jgi:peptidoglycan/LPS O-acetylase OafA/YrhL